MMKKTMATALFSVLAVFSYAGNSGNKIQPDSTLIVSGRTNQFAQLPDTQFVSSIAANPLFSYQNLVYKRRLDSLERSVSLDYNDIVQNYIDIYAFGRKEQIGKMLGLSKYYFPIFERSLKEVGMPDELKFISVIESSLNPHAVSRSGAVGPWQFMYTTAKGYGLIMDSFVDERKDPAQASYAAALYLRDAYRELGDWLLAIAAYNCGTGSVKRAIARAGGGPADFWKIRPYLPRETQNYVPAFIATVYVMNYYNRHDIYPRSAEFNIHTDVIDVNRFISLEKIASATDINLKELSTLNPSYKRKVVNGSPQSPKKLVIPAVDRKMYSSIYEILNSDESLEPKLIAASTFNETSEILQTPSTHKVKEGQTLQMVADQHGVEVQDLKVWNKLSRSTIVPGQVLRLSRGALVKPIPARSAYLTYIVKAGDTLSEIVDKFKGTTTVSKLKAINGLKSSSVQPGMRLKINRG